ncbi:MAG: hypothetical protein J0I48_15390 [Devosia sp.]|uniref:hypothetical protein n=1 Tax=Devosia sp. 66-22 TaxID=1895753 RepID=UPI00092AB2EF|nr:hypothetical protein [Devosia sp. 66-22]MBN9347554.1 hypothetical protein [Devosia sp.]OJX50669.1 MAG: hypothetical protein BGO81_20690 [Devosia sp. 66-22]
MTTLTAQTFDAMTRRREKPVWTIEAIGNIIGVGPDFVRTLAAIEGSPIHQVGGRWFCYESELIEWMKGQRAA